MKAIDFASASHPGLVRDHNEDACLSQPELKLWAVADGMGGYEGGEVASAIVVEELERQIRGGARLDQAVEACHQAIVAAVARGEGAPEMGSTLVAVRFDNARYQIAWVGDSRAYLWNGTGLRQLTRDHSYVQLLLASGLIGADEVATHPNRNVILQALGVGGPDGAPLQVDVIDERWRDGDTLLLCSDGLSGEVSNSAIADILATESDNQTRVDRLIAAALDHGARDNVSVVVLSA
ncbi:MAG: serine/threonine-protein phosphatase [Methylococcaceae bacterium]|nr:serine/threonine-protein phosphatase [Methylococcaceae bacterium]